MGGLSDFFGGGGGVGALAGLGASVLVPGLGGAIGQGASDLFDLGLSPTTAQAVGNALVGGGLGYLTGGGKGALSGALVGGITPFAADALGVGGGIAGSLPTEAQGGYGPDIPKGVDTASGSGALSGLFGGSGSGGALSKAVPLLVMAGALSGLSGKGQGSEQPVIQQGQQEAIDQQKKPLSTVKFSRSKQPVMPKGDLTQYGYGPEHEFYKNNKVPGYAAGGDVAGYDSAPQYVPSQGNPGRSDKIPSLLSDGEYVFDSETVALLGDGNPDAGAAQLDVMRENIRRHKGGALSRGRISPDAKPALAYLPQKGALDGVRSGL